MARSTRRRENAQAMGHSVSSAFFRINGVSPRGFTFLEFSLWISKFFGGYIQSMKSF